MKGLGSQDAIELARPSVRFCGLLVGQFQLGDVCRHLLCRGPPRQEVAQHLLRSLRRFAARPQGDEQAGDDGAVRLNRDPVLVVTEQVATTEQMLELTEEDLDRLITIPP